MPGDRLIAFLAWCLMPHPLSHRCALAILLALSLGLAAALWGWGSIGLPQVAVFHEGVPVLLQAPLWAAAALAALAAWIQFLLARGQRRVCDVTWPWRLFLALIVLRASFWVVQNSATNETHLIAIQLGTQLTQAGLGMLLCWGWLAERFSAFRPAKVAWPVCATLLAVAVWWYGVPAVHGGPASGDARVILLLQLLPLVVLLAGVLRLPGRLLACGESLWMATAYALTWLITWWPVMDSTAAALTIVASPWLLFSLLCFMVLILMNSSLRTQQNPSRAGPRLDRRGSAPAWLAHFRFDAWATSNRRINS